MLGVIEKQIREYQEIETCRERGRNGGAPEVALMMRLSLKPTGRCKGEDFCRDLDACILDRFAISDVIL